MTTETIPLTQDQEAGASLRDRATAVEPVPVSPLRDGIPSAEKNERHWMKEPCGPCPFSRTKTLWLHPERAEDFANMASNPYTDFPCHKTADLVEDHDGSGAYVQGTRSLTCNGFLSLQCNENDRSVAGFRPHADAFGDTWEMIDHHTEHWEAEQERIAQAIEARRAGTAGSGAQHESAVATPCAQTPSSEPTP